MGAGGRMRPTHPTIDRDSRHTIRDARLCGPHANLTKKMSYEH